MAGKSLTVVRAGRYGTRMLKAGDVYDATGPDARLYTKLGWMKEGRPLADVPPPPEKVAAKAKAATAKPKAKRTRKAKK